MGGPEAIALAKARAEQEHGFCPSGWALVSAAGVFIPGASNLASLKGKAEGLAGKVETAVKLAETGRKVAEAEEEAEALKVRVPPSFANVRVSLLPLANQSVDLLAPVLLRQLLQMRMSAAGFRLEGLEWIDARLKEAGITDGGQLGSQKHDALGERLQSEALLYGEVLEFNQKNLGVYASRTVEARLRLVDAKTGRTLWEGTRKKTNPKVALTGDSIKANLAAGLGTKLLENALQSPLRAEVEDVVRQLMKDMVAGLEKR